MKTIIIPLILAHIIFQSCISIKESSFRNDIPKVIEGENYKISSTGEICLNMLGLIKADFEPASIKLEFDSIRIFVDPVVVNDTNSADFIFVTHSHMDHFSITDIEKLSNRKTVVIGPATVTKKLKDSFCKTVRVGDNIDLGQIKCEVIDSYNLKSKIHKKGSKFLGYIISYHDVRVYLAGDTDFIPEMKEMKNITVAIIPIGEGKTAMNPESAAEASNLIKPDIVIPYHYEIGKGNESDFERLISDSIQIKFLR